MIKVGIVGAGFMGTTHAQGYAQVADTKIIGIADMREEPCRKLAAQHSAEAFATIDDLLARKPDIVDICLPTPMHPDAVARAAKAGANILLEKPIALTLKAADEIIEVVRKNKVRCMIAHVLRFWPEYVKIREVLLLGTLGKPLTAGAIRVSEPPGWSGWFKDASQSGGVCVDLMIHDFDMCNWLFGKPVTAYAAATENFGGGWFDMNAIVSYESGVSVSFKGSQMMPKGYPFTMGLRIQGTKGTLDFLFRAGANVENRAEAQKDFVLFLEDGTAKTLTAEGIDGYAAEVAYFVECVKKNRPVDRGTPEEGRLALEVGLACARSAKEGRVIKL